MLDQTTRSAILRLREEGHGTRRIAAALGVSRATVRAIVALGDAAPPRIVRVEKADAHRAEILALFASCRGNLVRVHEELEKAGAQLSYQALTGFCRRHGIGHEPKVPAGHYVFAPGKEMQHDTSPHKLTLRKGVLAVETASLKLAHSTLLYFQFFRRFRRFECKLFLHDATAFLGATCETCMIDNTHIVVLRGTGPDMVPVPEMAAFGERYGFEFRAHHVGDPNRKAHVERAFHFIENNFLAGRIFEDIDEANSEAIAWCNKVNAKFRNSLHASPRELFAAERAHMKSLPIFVPEPYQLHCRLVDVEGYVNLHTIRYSVPAELLGKQLELREGKKDIAVFDGPRLVITHAKVEDRPHARITAPEHRAQRSPRAHGEPSPDETTILAAVPDLGPYLAVLKARHASSTVVVRRLARMLREYPRDAFVAATTLAAQYGLYDLERVERLVLKNVARDFFPTLLGELGARNDRANDDDDDGGVA